MNAREGLQRFLWSPSNRLRIRWKSERAELMKPIQITVTWELRVPNHNKIVESPDGLQCLQIKGRYYRPTLLWAIFEEASATERSLIPDSPGGWRSPRYFPEEADELLFRYFNSEEMRFREVQQGKSDPRHRKK